VSLTSFTELNGFNTTAVWTMAVVFFFGIFFIILSFRLLILMGFN